MTCNNTIKKIFQIAMFSSLKSVKKERHVQKKMDIDSYILLSEQLNCFEPGTVIKFKLQNFPKECQNVKLTNMIVKNWETTDVQFFDWHFAGNDIFSIFLLISVFNDSQMVDYFKGTLLPIFYQSFVLLNDSCKTKRHNTIEDFDEANIPDIVLFEEDFDSYCDILENYLKKEKGLFFYRAHHGMSANPASAFKEMQMIVKSQDKIKVTQIHYAEEWSIPQCVLSFNLKIIKENFSSDLRANHATKFYPRFLHEKVGNFSDVSKIDLIQDATFCQGYDTLAHKISEKKEAPLLILGPMLHCLNKIGPKEGVLFQHKKEFNNYVKALTSYFKASSIESGARMEVVLSYGLDGEKIDLHEILNKIYIDVSVNFNTVFEKIILVCQDPSKLHETVLNHINWIANVNLIQRHATNKEIMKTHAIDMYVRRFLSGTNNYNDVFNLRKIKRTSIAEIEDYNVDGEFTDIGAKVITSMTKRVYSYYDKHLKLISDFFLMFNCKNFKPEMLMLMLYGVYALDSTGVKDDFRRGYKYTPHYIFIKDKWNRLKDRRTKVIQYVLPREIQEVIVKVVIVYNINH